MQAECVANNHNCKALYSSLLKASWSIVQKYCSTPSPKFFRTFDHCFLIIVLCMWQKNRPSISQYYVTFRILSCRRQILELVLVATHIPKESWPTSLILCSAKTLDRRGRQGPHQIRSQGQMMIVSHSIKKRDVQHCY